MPSNALSELKTGINEVLSLRTLSPVRDTLARGDSAATARAHGRASVVLLSGHYERYIRAVNEEALQWLSDQSITSNKIPDQIKLRHSKASINELVAANWDNRKQKLIEFSSSDSLLWNESAIPPLLDHSKVLVMKSPRSKEIEKFYRMYELDSVFMKITRKPHNAIYLSLKLQEMVDKRNNIAHGDFTTEALPSEIMSYIDSVKKFCERADKLLSFQLKRIAKSSSKPW